MGTAYDTWLEGDCGVDSSQQGRDEAIYELANEYQEIDEKMREAQDFVWNGYDQPHYVDVDLVLFDLHTTDPDKLLDSAVLPKLYALAKTVHMAIRERLEQMAEESIDETLRGAE